MILRLVLLASVSIACPSSSFAANPFVGTWKVDLTKVRNNPPSFVPPADLTFRIEAAGEDAVRIAEDATTKANGVLHVTRTCKLDGKDCPLSGSARPAATEAIRRVDSHTWDITMKSEGKVIRQTQWTISSDGGSLTISGWGLSPTGEKRESFEVFVRQ
jgi:hypothetical protein